VGCKFLLPLLFLDVGWVAMLISFFQSNMIWAAILLNIHGTYALHSIYAGGTFFYIFFFPQNAFSCFRKYCVVDIRHNTDDPALAGWDLLLTLIDVELFSMRF